MTDDQGEKHPDQRAPEPLEQAEWRPLHRLLAHLDEQIAEVYRRRGITDVRPRFVGPLILLARHRSLTIRELAELSGRTHSALSQTVTALRKQGLVESAPGTDARTRRVTLTPRGRELVPLMEAEWHATEEAVRRLDREIPYPMVRVVADIERALQARSFADRVEDQLPGSLRRPADDDEDA